MKTNLKINGQQTVKVGATTPKKPPMVFLSVGVNLNGGPQTVQGAQKNGKRI